MPTKCFWMEPTSDAEVWLRRFVFSSNQTVPCLDEKHYHNASVIILDRTPVVFETIEGRTYLSSLSGTIPKDDPRWPAVCEHCGYRFTPNDQYQVNQRRLYRRIDTNEDTITLEAAPAGALWDCDWMPDWAREEDGLTVVAMVPGGYTWHIDGCAANNCPYRGHPRPDGHHCWSRTGDPRHPETLTVRASIQTPNYHGFLTNGIYDP